jgi:hypothetical protein
VQVFDPYAEFAEAEQRKERQDPTRAHYGKKKKRKNANASKEEKKKKQGKEEEA